MTPEIDQAAATLRVAQADLRFGHAMLTLRLTQFLAIRPECRTAEHAAEVAEWNNSVADYGDRVANARRALRTLGVDPDTLCYAEEVG